MMLHKETAFPVLMIVIVLPILKRSIIVQSTLTFIASTITRIRREEEMTIMGEIFIEKR